MACDDYHCYQHKNSINCRSILLRCCEQASDRMTRLFTLMLLAARKNFNDEALCHASLGS